MPKVWVTVEKGTTLGDHPAPLLGEHSRWPKRPSLCAEGVWVNENASWPRHVSYLSIGILVPSRIVTDRRCPSPVPDAEACRSSGRITTAPPTETRQST